MAQLRETVRAAFAHYDADGSGAIDAKELRRLVADLGGYLTDKELASALAALDRDADGVIDLDEFTRWWTAQSGDLDGDGQVGELERAMERVKASGQDRFRVDIHSAAWRGACDAVQRLLDDDAELVHDPDATEYGGGNTALHYAAYQGHIDVCALVIARGAKVNAVNACGCTPLFLAAQQSRLEVVTMLVEHGADIRIAERKHQLTAVDVCSSDEILACFRARAGGVPCVPDPPRIVVAQETTMSIEWSTPRDKHDQIAPISGYKVRVTPVAVSPSSSVPPVSILVGALPTHHTIEGLTPDTTYTAQLAAINLHGISAFSSPSEPTRTRIARPPAPSGIRARAVDAASIELAWDTATGSDASQQITHIVVQQCVDPSVDLWKSVGRVDIKGGEADGSICRFVVPNLLDAHRYRFRMAAVSAVAGQSDFSAPIDARTRSADGTDAKLTPRTAAGEMAPRKSRVGVRDVVGVVQRIRSEAKRVAATPSYPLPQDAVEPRAASRSVVKDRLRGVSTSGTKTTTNGAHVTQQRRVLSENTATLAPDTKEPSLRYPVSTKQRPHEVHRDRKHTHHDHSGDANSDEDEYMYYSDSGEEEEEVIDRER